MKVHRPGDTIAPIVTNLQTSDDVGGLNPWVVGLTLIAFGITMWVPGSPFTGSPSVASDEFHSHTVTFGFGLLLGLGGTSILSRRVPAIARFGSRHRLAVVITGIAGLLLTFGPVALLVVVPGGRLVGMIFVIGFVINFVAIPLWLVERRNARRIAVPVPVAQGAAPMLATPGELVIALYEIDDLPVSRPTRTHLTVDSNIVGQPPCRFLYFYNFFADAISVTARPTAGWRRHGPVSMLASPLDLARAAGYRLGAAQSVDSRLLTNPAMIEERVAAMSDVPLPPAPQPSRRTWWISRWNDWTSQSSWWRHATAEAALPRLFADLGAYPEDVLLCTDATWHAGVTALTARAHKVIVDAADFSGVRVGLAWEIQYVVNHFATQDFVILVNSFTDFPALGAELRRAWSDMAATSPNNRSNEACVRAILWTGDDQGGFDDDSSRGARPGFLRDRERVEAHDRVVVLLRGDHRPSV